jgi:hypothetical protein
MTTSIRYKWMQIGDDGQLKEPRQSPWGPKPELNPWGGFHSEQEALDALEHYCADQWQSDEYTLIKIFRCTQYD